MTGGEKDDNLQKKKRWRQQKGTFIFHKRNEKTFHIFQFSFFLQFFFSYFSLSLFLLPIHPASLSCFPKQIYSVRSLLSTITSQLISLLLLAAIQRLHSRVFKWKTLTTQNEGERGGEKEEKHPGHKFSQSL